jgi:hypothetical protein
VRAKKSPLFDEGAKGDMTEYRENKMNRRAANPDSFNSKGAYKDKHSDRKHLNQSLYL